MLRAARFIARYELEPTEQLVAAVKQMAARLEIVSAERIRDEFDKLMTVDHPSTGLWFLYDTGLSDQFLPELSLMRLEHDPIHRHKDVLSPHDRRRRERAAAARAADGPAARSTSGSSVWRRCSTTSASRAPAATWRARARRSITTTPSAPA